LGRRAQLGIVTPMDYRVIGRSRVFHRGALRDFLLKLEVAGNTAASPVHLTEGCHLVAAFMTSGYTLSIFFRMPSRLCPAIGCSTTTRDNSGTLCSLSTPFNVSAKWVVVIVTVGTPIFSRLSWSTTSHEVQIPQSA
jgi:hypothetical protein